MSDVVFVDGEDTLVVVETVENTIVYTPDTNATADIVEVDLGVIAVDGEVTEITVETVEETVIYTPDLTSTYDILTVGEQGPPGPAGSGLNSNTFAMPVVGATSGHRAMRSDGTGHAVYASSDSTPDANTLIGISISAAAPGADIVIQHSGLLTEPGWSWTPNQPVFCGVNGALTQTPPASGFCLVVGVPTSPTTLSVDIKQPIITT